MAFIPLIWCRIILPQTSPSYEKNLIIQTLILFILKILSILVQTINKSTIQKRKSLLQTKTHPKPIINPLFHPPLKLQTQFTTSYNTQYYEKQITKPNTLRILKSQYCLKLSELFMKNCGKIFKKNIRNTRTETEILIESN